MLIVQSTRDPLLVTPQKLLQRVPDVSPPLRVNWNFLGWGTDVFCTPPSQVIYWEGKGLLDLDLTQPKEEESGWNGGEVTSHLTRKVLS